MIDIHCHILPEVDDGARSWEIALEMCELAKADGVRHIVASPHAHERFAYDRASLQRRLEELRQRSGNGIEFSLGCDFQFSYENLIALRERPQDFVIGETPYLLVELSNFSLPPQVDETLLTLADLAITPVITHPERNPILQQSLGRVVRWAQLGCAVQVTASALTGSFGERSRRAAEMLLQHRAVHVLASDGHDSQHRKPLLSTGRDAAAAICGEAVALALVEDNPLAIVQGQALPYFPEPVV